MKNILKYTIGLPILILETGMLISSLIFLFTMEAIDFITNDPNSVFGFLATQNIIDNILRIWRPLK